MQRNVLASLAPNSTRASCVLSVAHRPGPPVRLLIWQACMSGGAGGSFGKCRSQIMTQRLSPLRCGKPVSLKRDSPRVF